MQIINHLSQLCRSSSLSSGPAALVGKQLGVTMGNFDGVHLGHQALIQDVQRECQKKNLHLVVLTFTPHPHEIFFPQKDHFLINSYAEKRIMLEQQGVEFLLEINFDAEVASLSPATFLDRYLLPFSDCIAEIFPGYNFSFGADKKGTFDFLKNYLSSSPILVSRQNEFLLQQQKVSSSAIRDLILGGDMPQAAALLGRPFYLAGVVTSGKGRGHKIGFPTANIEVPQKQIIPAKGVYITQTIFAGKIYPSLTNIGFNPTFEQIEKMHVETHILGLNTDLYHQPIQVNFLQKIRDEKRFNSVQELTEQIQKDQLICENYFR